DKGRKSSFMRDIFISYWINYKKRQKRKKLEGTLFGHPLFCILLANKSSRKAVMTGVFRIFAYQIKISHDQICKA
ncbi:MAG: hypothetical protein UC662_01450, partial [Paraprevotella clara]|nr:hypothetical protein [Paraprevotella clara]